MPESLVLYRYDLLSTQFAHLAPEVLSRDINIARTIRIEIGRCHSARHKLFANALCLKIAFCSGRFNAAQIIMKYSQSAVQERAYLHTVAIKQHTGHTNPHTRGIVAYVLRMPTTHLHRRRMHAHISHVELFLFDFASSFFVVVVAICNAQ